MENDRGQRPEDLAAEGGFEVTQFAIFKKIYLPSKLQTLKLSLILTNILIANSKRKPVEEAKKCYSS